MTSTEKFSWRLLPIDFSCSNEGIGSTVDCRLYYMLHLAFFSKLIHKIGIFKRNILYNNTVSRSCNWSSVPEMPLYNKQLTLNENWSAALIMFHSPIPAFSICFALRLHIQTFHVAIWVFSPVVIPLSKKAPPLYEDVGSNLGIFKIYVCVSLD